MRRRRWWLRAAERVPGAAGVALAHEVRPGYLDLRESGPATHALLWKQPTGSEVAIPIAPVTARGSARFWASWLMPRLPCSPAYRLTMIDMAYEGNHEESGMPGHGAGAANPTCARCAAGVTAEDAPAAGEAPV
jgi:hypothetical protein